VIENVTRISVNLDKQQAAAEDRDKWRCRVTKAKYNEFLSLWN